MLNIPVLRWGEPYTSLDVKQVIHFATGEPIASVSQSNAGLVQRDLRKADQARATLRKIDPQELLQISTRAAEIYLNGTVPMGDGQQSPQDFVRQQSASTGLPESLCKANMAKCHLVLSRMGHILECLTRGLDPGVLARGYGEERGVTISYQAQSPVVGAVLPNNSPGVHTLWLPVIALQVGLALKPGSQEPWTPYRIVESYFAAGLPRNAVGLYPGPTEVGAAILSHCKRALIFGSAQTVAQYASNPGVQVHGPGFSKILLGEDSADRWEDYLDLMVQSVFANSGRSCINASTIWAPRHGPDIAEALAKRLAGVEVRPPDDPKADLAAFVEPGIAEAIDNAIEADLKTPGVTDHTARHRGNGRLVKQQRADYLLPTVLHASTPDAPVVAKEYMFPFVTVVDCPQSQMLARIGPTLVCTAISGDQNWRDELLNATCIDRLNFGPIPTNQLNWLQPHEGNLVDFLFRARAFQQVDQG